MKVIGVSPILPSSYELRLHCQLVGYFGYAALVGTENGL